MHFSLSEYLAFTEQLLRAIGVDIQDDRLYYRILRSSLESTASRWSRKSFAGLNDGKKYDYCAL